MNHQKKILFRIVVLLGIVVSLSGCATPSIMPTIGGEENQKIEESIQRDGQQNDETTSQVLSPTQESTRIIEEVNEDFHVDATVTGYPVDEKAGVYFGSPKDFTKEEIESFIKHCGVDIVSVKEWDDGAMVYYNGECTNGYNFGYMWGLDGLNNHPYAEFRFYDTKHYMTYYDYPIYSGGEQTYLTNPQYTVGWMFTEPKEFSFATKTEAEATVREALTLLGLSDLTLLRTLYIDHNILEEAGELLTTDEKYAPIGESIENNGYNLRDDWSENDDAYMFNFGMSVSGTPMSYLFDDSGETATYCGTEIIVWYTKNGITFLSVNTPWSVEGEEISPEKIISPYEALEVAKDKYGNILNRKDIEIEEIRLLYKYMQDRDRWLFRPIWTVRISYLHGDSDERYYEFMYIDALSGREL